MNKNFICRLGSPLIIACLAAFSSLASASTITLLDSSQPPDAGSDGIAQYGPLYASFSTPSGGSVSLSDVLFKLQNIGGSASTSGEVSVGLYSSNSLRPGSLLLTLGTVSESSLPPVEQIQTYSFSLAPTYTLAADTRYWIGFSSVGGTDAGLVWTEDDSGPGVASEYNIYDGQLYPNSDGPYQLKITGETAGSSVGSSVPEPSAALLVAGGIFAGLFVRRRRHIALLAGKP